MLFGREYRAKIHTVLTQCLRATLYAYSSLMVVYFLPKYNSLFCQLLSEFWQWQWIFSDSVSILFIISCLLLGIYFVNLFFTCVWVKWYFLYFAVDVSLGWEGKEAWEMCGVQHGNWSVWGTWTECLAEAWAGVRKRTRTRTDPVPRRGGRPCVGESVQYEPCSLGLGGKDLLTETDMSEDDPSPVKSHQ